MTYVALLRGINVGGKNLVPMAALRNCLVDAGLENVRTYIQSGNVVFESGSSDKKALVTTVRDAMGRAFDLAPAVLVLEASELSDAVAACPYLSGPVEDKFIHLTFLDGDPTDGAVDAATELATKTEQFALLGRVFFLMAPDGIGRSKLAARIETVVGVGVTSRNLRSCRKILALAEGG
ncbi:MAG: DUF1697 domain-containing protein [Pseudomonadota bacterium]